MRYWNTVGIGIVLCSLAACSWGDLNSSLTETGLPEESSSSSSEETFIDAPAAEVTYQGTLEALDPRISLQGSHRLSLGGGSYLLLESDAVDLSAYEGEVVRVTGAVRSTIDDDGLIMRVTQIESMLVSSDTMETASSSSVENEVTFFSSSETSSATIVAESSSSSVLAQEVQSSSRASSRAPVVAAPASSSRSSQATSSSLPPPSDENSSRAAAMQKAASDATKWTQQYCSSHVGFCIPVHKNWWYKSFGVTASSLWHVELNNAEIENMGDGLIVVTFRSGSLPEGTADGAVAETEGNAVTGYKAWTGQRHFEVTAPTELRSAVEYIITNLTTYEAPGQ